MHCLNPHTNP